MAILAMLEHGQDARGTSRGASAAGPGCMQFDPATHALLRKQEFTTLQCRGANVPLLQAPRGKGEIPERPKQVK